MPIDAGDVVLTFLGDTTQLDAAFTRVGADAQAKIAPVAEAMTATSVAAQGTTVAFEGAAQAVDGMAKEMAVGQSGAVELGTVTNLAGEKVRASMYEARGEVGLLGEAVGINLPRHVRSFVAELPIIGEALSSAFQFTAVLFLIEALAQGVEKLQEWAEHSHKVALAMDEFNIAVLNSFNGLNDKLLEAGIKIDDLRGNHVAALQKELELIDHQSMEELEKEFGLLAKAADAAFAQLSTSWYELDRGSKGATNAIHDFKTEYELLLAEGRKKEASDLLAGTLDSAKKSLESMQALKKAADEAAEASEKANAGHLSGGGYQYGGPGDDQIKAQEKLVEALQAQITAQGKINELANDNKSIKVTEDAQAAAKRAAAAQKQYDSEELQALRAMETQHQKNDADDEKFLNFQLSREQKKKEASASTAKEELQHIHDLEEAQLAQIDGEMKADEAATSHKAQLLKTQYDTGLLSGQQYLAKLKDLYAADLQALIQMLNRKEQLVILEAQNEAAQRGKIITDEEAKELKGYVDLEAKKKAIQDEYTSKILKAQDQVTTHIAKNQATIGSLLDDYTKKLRSAERELQGFGKVADATLNDISQSFGSAISDWLSGQETFGAALEKALAQYLIQVGSKAAIDALYFTAWGIADSFWNPARAGADFTAAAEFAAIAAVAGGAGAALSRSSGSSESSTGSSTGGSDNSPATQAQPQPTGGINAPKLYGGGLITAPTLALVGDSPSGGRAHEGVIPLDDPEAMNSIASSIASYMGASGGGGVHIHVDGMISPDKLTKVIKQMDRQISKRQGRLTAGNSFRLTRRG